jgi:hypothetical protein
MSNEWYGDGPVCVAMLICHDVIEDKRSSNKTVVNIFNAVGASQLPATQQRLTVMATITNNVNETPLQLVVRTPSGKEEISASGTLPPGQGDDAVDVLFELHGMQIREFGNYQVELTSAGERLAMRKFRCIQVKGQ